MEESGPLEYLNGVYELNEICRQMGDDDLSDAMNMIIKLVAKPDVPAKAAAPLVVQMQAWAASFRMKAKYWMIYNKEGDAAKKKNTYLTMADSLNSLCDSLKYLCKAF